MSDLPGAMTGLKDALYNTKLPTMKSHAGGWDAGAARLWPVQGPDRREAGCLGAACDCHGSGLACWRGTSHQGMLLCSSPHCQCFSRLAGSSELALQVLQCAGALTAFRTAVAPEAISTIHLSGNVSKAEKPARQLSPLPVVSTWHSQGLQRMITLLQALDPALCERHH